MFEISSKEKQGISHMDAKSILEIYQDNNKKWQARSDNTAVQYICVTTIE